MSPVARPDELSLQHKRTSSFTSKDEPSTVRQNRGLLPSIAHPDELSLQTQAVELLQLTKKSPAAHSMSPVTHPDELSLQHKRQSLILTSSPFNTSGQAPLLQKTSPPLYEKTEGSALQSFTLTSSPFNTSGRAPATH